MGRRKKLTEAELENTQTALTIDTAQQSESEEAELLAESEPALEEVEAIQAEEEPASEAQETVSAPKKPRKPRSPKKIEATEKPEDPWLAIQALSNSVQKLVEHNQAAPKHFPNAFNENPLPLPRLDLDTHELLRPQTPQNSSQFITKFAVAASIVAVLISLVSLALSQSARQAAVGSSQIAHQAGPAINITRGAKRH